MADGSLTFVVPVRDGTGVANWSNVKGLMAATIGSLAHAGGRIVVVANRGADLPDLPYHADLLEIDMKYAPLPPVEGEERWAAVRRDKGRRVVLGLIAAKPKGHVMVVDYDDFVSDKIPRLVAANPEWPGWYVDQGYLFDGGPVVMHVGKFDRLCGTSLIVRADLLPIPDSESQIDDNLTDRALGSHIYLRGDLERAGTPLVPTQFPAAVYRIGHAESTSPTTSIFGNYLALKSVIRRPKSWLKNAGRLRPTSLVRREFGMR